MQTTEEQTFYAVITHKSRQVAELVGDDPKALEDRAHRYAANLNMHRAVVQVSQGEKTLSRS